MARAMYDYGPEVDDPRDYSDKYRYKRDYRGKLAYTCQKLRNDDREITTVFGKHISLQALIHDGWHYRLKQKKLAANITLILSHEKHKFTMKFKAPCSIAHVDDDISTLIGKIATGANFCGIHNSATPVIRVVVKEYLPAPASMKHFTEADLRNELKARKVRDVEFLDTATLETLQDELAVRGVKWSSWPSANDLSTAELLEIINARYKSENTNWAADLTPSDDNAQTIADVA